MPLSKEQVALYRAQRAIPGPAYQCTVCPGNFSGGRYFLVVERKFKLVCPSCWPDVLNKLENLMEATHAD